MLIVFRKSGKKVFEAAIKKRISEKQTEYDNLLKNISASALPAPVLTEIGKKMESLLEEIRMLENTEPPEEHTVDSAFAWLDSLNNASERQAIRLLIERLLSCISRIQDYALIYVNGRLRRCWRTAQ